MDPVRYVVNMIPPGTCKDTNVSPDQIVTHRLLLLFRFSTLEHVFGTNLSISLFYICFIDCLNHL